MAQPDTVELLRAGFAAVPPSCAAAAMLIAGDRPGAGWGVAEPHGRWVLGAGASLALPGLAEPGSCLVELDLTPYVHPPALRFQDITLSLNGIEVMRLRLTRRERIRMPLPAILAQPGVALELGIACPGAAAPRSLGAGSDSRMLGVALHRLAILQSRAKRHFPPPPGMRAFPPPPPAAPLLPSPAPTPGSRPLLAICAILRNEGRYIHEWLRFHHAVGVRRFVLYDNASTDDMAAEIARFAHASCVTVVPWLGYNAQNAAYAHMLAEHRDVAEWCAFIDADEFIVPRGDLGLEALLRGLPEDCGGLFLHWLMFGSAGQAQYAPAPVTERFTRRGPDSFPPNRVGKTVLRLCRARQVRNPHIIQCHGRLLNDAGEAVDQDGPGIHTGISHRHVALHHYFTKSAEEWQWRRAGRTTGAQGHDQSRDAAEFQRHDVNAVQDASALAILNAALQPA